MGLVAAAMAQDGQAFSNQFYSFVPAPPKLDAPSQSDAPLWHNDMQKAKKAYRNADYEKARQHLETALADGNVLAAWYLGHIWRLGLGVPASPARAFDYYRQVALAYDPQEPRPGALDMMVDALVRVADGYRDGDEALGISKDPIRAYRLYSTAAGHGHPRAQFGLGVMYLKGLGVRENSNQAIRWLMLAARKRYSPAEALLGDLYWDGSIVARDRAFAIMWYVLATRTARPDTHRHIFDRLETMLAEASDNERQSGQKSAELWADRYPAENAGFAPDETD